MHTKKILDAVAAVEAVNGTSYALYQAADRLAYACELVGEEIWRRAEGIRSDAFRLTDGRGERMTEDERTAALSRVRSSLTQIRQLLARSAS